MVVLGRVREVDRVRALTPDGCEVTSDSTLEDVTEIAPCPPGSGQLVLQLGRVTEVDLVRAVAIESGAMLVALGRVVEVDRVRRVNPQSCSDTPGDCEPTVTWNDTVAVDDAFGANATLPDTFSASDLLSLRLGLADSLALADSLGMVLNATFFDSLGVSDNFATTVNLQDTVAISENLTTKVGLSDTFGLADLLTTTIVGVQPDTFGIDDALSRATFSNVTFGPSGTPDTDPSGDSWVDQANTAVNHGTETTAAVKGKSTLANDERRALLEFDFTRYGNMTAFVGGGHALVLDVRNLDLLVAMDFIVELSRTVARPFTESTVTWTNQPAAGTIIKTQTFNIAANSASLITLTLTDAQLNDLLGDWGYVRVTSPTGPVPPAGQVGCREFAGTGSDPRWGFSLKR